MKRRLIFCLTPPLCAISVWLFVDLCVQLWVGLESKKLPASWWLSALAAFGALAFSLRQCLHALRTDAPTVPLFLAHLPLLWLALSIPFFLIAPRKIEAKILAPLTLLVSSLFALYLHRLWSSKSEIRNPKSEIILFIFAFTYWLLFTALAIRKHLMFHSTHDLAALDHAYWWTLRGKFFWNSFEGRSHFQVHFSPILLSHLPFYALLPAPQTLLTLQSLFLSAAALALYALCRALALPPLLSATLAVAYLLHPGTAAIHLNDFYAEGHAPLFIFLTAYFLVKGNLPAYLLCFALMLCIKQSLWAIGFMFVLILLKQRRSLQWLVLPAAMLAAHAVACKLLLKPFYDPYSTYFGKLTSISDAFQRLSQDSGKRLFYLFAIYAPLGFVPPLLTRFALLPLPLMGIYLLSTWWVVYSVWYHYSAPVVAAVFVGAAFGLQRLIHVGLASSPARGARCTAYAMERTLALLLLFFAIPPTATWLDHKAFKPHPRYEAFQQALRRVPPDAFVQAPSTLIPHLAHRPRWTMGDEPKGDFIIVNTNLKDMLVEAEQEGTKRLLQHPKLRRDYRLLWEGQGVRVYQRVTSPPEKQ